MNARSLICSFACLTFFDTAVFAQVNLQTGASEANFPLYGYSNPSSRLNFDVSLTYVSGNGLKVNDITSSVGAGWFLNCGGVIAREQHGEPDDQKQDGTFVYPTLNASEFLNYVNNYYPNGYMYSEFNPTTLVDNGAGYSPLVGVPGGVYKPAQSYIADREQDIFRFSFNGQTGSFLIGKDGSIKTTVDSKLKIDKVITNMLSSNIITRISEFHITDENGIKYVFKDLQLSERMIYKADNNYGGLTPSYLYPLSSYPVVKSTLYKGEAQNKLIVSNWFLSEIINTLTNTKILLQYDDYNFDMPGSKTGYVTVSSDNRTQVNLTIDRVKGVAKRISKVVLSPKEEIQFVYSPEYRKDLPFDRSLDYLNIKYDGEIKYKWSFNYGYFVMGNIKLPSATFTQEEQYQSRLCLLSFKKTDNSGSVSEPPTLFEYFIGNILTDFGGWFDYHNYEVSPINSFYQDEWGYSLYKTWGFQNPYLYQQRGDAAYSNITWGEVQSFTKNNLPAGASYGLRHYPGFNAKAGILRSIKYPYGGILSFEYERNRSKVFGGTTEEDVGGYRVSKTILYNGSNHTNDIINEYKYLTASGTSSGWGYEPFTNETARTNRVYKCSGANPPAILRETASAFVTTYFKYSFLGFASSQVLQASYKASFQSLIMNLIMLILEGLFTPEYQDYAVTEYSTASKFSNNPLPFLYSRVEVINKLALSTTGKTVSEFWSDQDYPIDVPILTVSNSSHPRFAHWVYGLPKNVTIYNVNGQIVKKKENIYQIFKSTFNNSNYASQSWKPNRLTFGCALYPGTGQPTNEVDHDVYYPIYGRAQLTQTKEYTYNNNNDYTLVTTDFEYNTNNYLPNKVKTLNSKGEMVEQTTYYVNDYTLAGAIQTMKDNNMVSVPISSQTHITKSGGQKYLLDGAVSEFGVITNGDIRPIKTYSFRSTNPILSTLVPFSSSQLLPNTTYYKETGSVIYDVNYGMPVQINTDQGKVSTIYDYATRLPVATVTNASADDIAYTSFEGGELGNWSYLSGSSWHTDKSITGKRSFSGTLIKGLINPGNYTVTAWCLGNGTIGVNNLPTGTPLLTIGEWKLYEWKLINVNTVEISADRMDEVRLYPSNAQMSTIVYDPFVGKTAECDVSNRIIYYEYDELGRLRTVRDENRNVIKTYEYNFKQ